MFLLSATSEVLRTQKPGQLSRPFVTPAGWSLPAGIAGAV